MNPAEFVDRAEERKLRKTVQNRLNQRRSRTRKREKAQTASQGRRPYQVEKWRYSYQRDADEAQQGTAAKAGRPRQFSNPSPTQDNLLHLIHANVFRGLFDNKLAILACASYLTRAGGSEFQIIPPVQVFPGRAAIIESSCALPTSLSPTLLQRTVVHATCIDLIPFPQIRNNIIEREGCFNGAELVSELVGNLVDPACFFVGLPRPSSPLPFPTEEQVYYHGQEDDDYTANRDGMILWGPAHRPENWEVTAGFLRKWGWLLRGCGDVIESSNRWRRSRGEMPLQLACISALSVGQQEYRA